MQKHIITPVSGPVDWTSVPSLPIDVQLWDTQTDISAQAQLCYDTEALHVHMSATEKDIRAKENGPLGFPCRDSCLEFFFSPIEGDSRYFNIEFSPTGCMYLGLGKDRYHLIRLIPGSELLVPKINLTQGGWEIFYSIPYSFIQHFFPDFSAEPGRNIRANFYKCGDLTVNKHYLSWNPIANPVPDYHLPAYFAPLYFG